MSRLNVLRFSPHASPPQKISVDTVGINYCGFDRNGRRHNYHLPPGELRWIPTGLLFETPLPHFLFKTPRELIEKKIGVVDWLNDIDGGFRVGLVSHRSDAISLVPNT